MKILVDQLPLVCGDCELCAKGMVMNELGVPSEVFLCTLRATLIPPQGPNDEPPLIDINKSPVENNCFCTDGKESPVVENNENKEDKDADRRELEKRAAASGIILS